MDSSTEDTRESHPSPLVSTLKNWYHVLAVELLFVFMLWTRVRPASKLAGDGTVYLIGTDSWYHFRQVKYTVANWPSTMPYDVWTNFASGTSSGQFGTLFDQIIATVALIVGLGDPSPETIRMTLFFAPAVIGALVAIPTYFIGSTLGDRGTGVASVALLAILPGEFFTRSVVGYGDHHVAETFFMTLSVACFLFAFSRAERDKPVYEQFRDRDFEAAKPTILWSALAGVALTMYILTWPPGALLIGILAVFYATKLSLDYYREVSPDHVAITGVISLSVATILLTVTADTFSFTAPKTHSLIQPGLTALTAAGAGFMAWLARQWDDIDVPRYGYPVFIAGSAVVGILLGKLAFPRAYGLLNNQIRNFLFFGQGDGLKTITEAQQFLSQANPRYRITAVDVIFQEYGLLLFIAVLGIVYFLYRTYKSRSQSAVFLFTIIWTAFLISAAFTQTRFNYYLAVPVAVLSGHFITEVIRFAGDSRTTDSITGLNNTQYVVIALVALFILPGLVVPATIGSAQGQPIKTDTVATSASDVDGSSVKAWHEPLTWMNENTPAVGTYGGADNEMGVYEDYGKTADYDYPDGAYGVMAWWDYGHWITSMSDRIPVANPFQQNTQTAANYLLAPSEKAANSVLENNDEDDAKTRYVMVDWQMTQAQGKLSAPQTFYTASDTRPNLYSQVYLTSKSQTQFGFTTYTQRYYESMAVRLYRYHGSAKQPEPVVVDYETQAFETSEGVQQIKTFPINDENSTAGVKTFESMEKAESYVQSHENAHIGGVGANPREKVDALQHYRLVKVSEESALSSKMFKSILNKESALAGLPPTQLLDTYPSWVKVFERVPGATITGTAPANTTVKASVEVYMPTVDKKFTYTQYAETGSDGTFTMTVPYSTVGGDKLTTEDGYTDSNVRATGPYVFTTASGDYTATANVTEAQVLGEDQSSVTVTLSEDTESTTDSGDE